MVVMGKVGHNFQRVFDVWPPPPPIGGWGEVAVDVGEILTLAMDKVNELNQFERFAADGFLW